MFYQELNQFILLFLFMNFLNIFIIVLDIIVITYYYNIIFVQFLGYLLL